MFKVINLYLAPFILLSIILTSKAYAYIDPGAGSMMFQILIAFAVGTLFTIKLWFKKVTLFVKKFFNKNNDATIPTE